MGAVLVSCQTLAMGQVVMHDAGADGGPHCPTCGAPWTLVEGEAERASASGGRRETWMCPNGHVQVRLPNHPDGGTTA
jgi:hypothetical protein